MKGPLQDVMEERLAQDKKWGKQDYGDLYWLGILMEEVGELAKSIIEEKKNESKTELTQVTAVGFAWLECIERRKDKTNG